MFSGAASCFYAFVGFDCITTMCEETNTPTRSVPRAILFTLLSCYVCYMLCSFVLVLVLPYNQVRSLILPGMYEFANFGKSLIRFLVITLARILEAVLVRILVRILLKHLGKNFVRIFVLTLVRILVRNLY